MKKIKFLFLFLVSALFLNAQNLLTNSSFENWTAGKPDSWTIGTTGTITQSSTTLSGSGSSTQVAATGTYSITQNVVAPNGTFDTSKKHKISVSYKTNAGDGTDSRVWCNWITSTVGAATTTYWSMTLSDSLGLKGPGGNKQPVTGVLGDGTNGYLLSNKASGNWETYTYTFFPPVGATQFSFQIRTYNGATVIWDDLYFGEDIVTDTNTSLNEQRYSNNISVINNTIIIKELNQKTNINIITTDGKIILNQYTENGIINLNNFKKGVYFIRYNNKNIKFVL